MPGAYKITDAAKKGAEKIESAGDDLFESTTFLTGIENGVRERIRGYQKEARALAKSQGVSKQYTDYKQQLELLKKTAQGAPNFQALQQNVGNLASALPAQLLELDDKAEELKDRINHAAEVREKGFVRSIDRVPGEALKHVKETDKKFDPFKEAEYRKTLEDELSNDEKAIKEAGREGSEIAKIKAIAHEVEQYHRKTDRATGRGFNKMLFKVGQELGLNGTEQQLDKALSMIQDVNTDRLANEVYEVALYTTEANTYRASLDEITFQHTTAAAHSYLSGITEAEIRRNGLSNTVKMPGVPELLIKEAEALTTETLMDKYRKRLNNVLKDLDEVQDGKDKRLGRVNGNINLFVASVHAALNEAPLELGKEDKELGDMLKQLDDAVDSKARRIGLKSVKVQIPNSLIRVASEHMKDLVFNEEDKVIEIAMFTYEQIAKAQNKSITEMEQTLDDYVREQLEIKMAFRGRPPRARQAVPPMLSPNLQSGP